jgi:SNF2 family DNA or RNA helicase
MDSLQAALMLASIKDFKGTFAKLQKEAEKKGIQVNPTLVISQMTTMRTVATCPELINKKFGSTIYKGPEGGGKIPYIRRIVDEKINQGGKVLILSDFRQMQETVERAVNSYGVIRFNTSWDDDDRREAFTKFQEDKDSQIFIAGTRAIREGVDLSAADTCICCDLLWSPAFQTQAWSRIMAPATRKRLCEVYLMLSANSLDEHIFNVFYSKMVAAEQALDRKVLNKRAQTIDIRWFVERVLEEELAISYYLRDAGEATMLVAELDLSALEEREI